MIAQSIILADNIAVDGSPCHVQVGGVYAWLVAGTWDAGDEVKLQMLMPDGSSYADISGAVMAADGVMLGLNLPNGCTVKLVIVNTPLAIYSRLVSC